MSRTSSPPPGLGSPLDLPVTTLRGVGPARGRALLAAGCSTLRDLLFHLPARWEDRRRRERIADLAAPGACQIRGSLTDLRLLRRRGGMTLLRGRLQDGSGTLEVVWFNQPYLGRRLQQGEWSLFGPAERTPAGGWRLVNPAVQPAGEAEAAPGLLPVYPALGSLGPAAVRRLLGEALRLGALPAGVADPLPEWLRARHALPSLGEALLALHRPGSDADPTALAERRAPASRRLVYGELLELQASVALARERQVATAKTHRYRLPGGPHGASQALAEQAPLPLTGAQRRVLAEILADLDGAGPMLRLLQGDVGSGKTAVAALALAAAAGSGLQGALLAPTELLANQHLRTLEQWLGGRFQLARLTAATPDPALARARLASGEAQIAVGTHALLEPGVRFRRLALAIIDEQQRFGVTQRRLLQAKGDHPDLLVMTATPIPRSLALTAYGDLELSLLDEVPPGRRPIATQLVAAGRRGRVYRWLAARARAGERAFVVFPRVEEGEGAGGESLAALGERVRRFLADIPTAVVHGRTPPPEREEALAGFASGRVRVLLASTVVEVGVDVPAASLMVIESAERFGLSQLHQLRGRVGRGEEGGRCVAIHGHLGEAARRRLALFATTADGFRIAEADLALRGPGELLGTRQSGLPPLVAADLARDGPWLELARRDARELLARRREPAAAAFLSPLAARLPVGLPPLAGG